MFFFFLCFQTSWRPGREAAALITHTCSISAEIVIHQTEEQVITNEGIQENTWEVKGRAGGLLVGKQPCSVRTQRGHFFIVSPDRLMDLILFPGPGGGHRVLSHST